MDCSKQMLLVLILATFCYLSYSQPDLRCMYAVGDYRNCTCGVQYRTVEKRCCSSESCPRPFMLSTENLTCTLECSNGGELDTVNNLCRCKPGYHGTCCEKETPLCGDVLVQHSGELSSLNFPSRYPSLTRCVWRISTDPNRRIALGVKDQQFDVEPGSNIYSCDYDHVSVYDGTSKKSKQLGRFCGNIDFPQTFRTVYSTGSHLYVEFKSDYIIQRKGFVLQYSVFFAGQECGPFAPLSTFTRRKGTITSPQYPIQYRPNEECVWTIQVIPGTEVILTMQDIDMPAQADCRFGDYLLVSAIRNEEKTDFGVYCGTKAFKPYRIGGEYDKIVLKFHSNDRKQGKGFYLTYEQFDLSSVSGTSSNEETATTANNGPELLVLVKT